MRSIYAVILVAVGLIHTSCDDEEIHGRPLPSGSCFRDPPLTYENFGGGFLAKHCNGCHSSLLRPGLRVDAPVGVDFDTFEQTVIWTDRIWERAVVQVSMPPGGGPGPEELERFREWMTCEVIPIAAEYRQGQGE